MWSAFTSSNHEIVLWSVFYLQENLTFFSPLCCGDAFKLTVWYVYVSIYLGS